MKEAGIPVIAGTIDAWAEAAGHTWSYSQVLPVFKRLEDNSRGASEYRGAGGPLVAGEIHPDAITHRKVLHALPEGVDDTYQLQQTVRRIVGRWVSNKHRRRPMIIPVVVEV
mgnify:CR=1 FL=1